MDSRPWSAPYRPESGEGTAAKDPFAPLGDARKHYWLALEMSRTVGLDLQSELDAGRIGHGDWSDMVTRCRGCDWAGQCPSWMEAARAAGNPEGVQAPGACANSARFNAMLALPDDKDRTVP